MGERVTSVAELDESLRATLTHGVARLATAGVLSPRHDVEVLAAHALDCERSDLWRHLDSPTPRGLDVLIERRTQREPLQHITGTAYFRHNALAVGPGVFIPRPETECVVDEALSILAELTIDRPVVVDLCAGSGAIALAIATEHPSARVHALEVSPEAVRWLRSNVADAGVQVLEADVAKPPKGLNRQVDLVISNPPYIPTGAVPRDTEVADFDPSLALYSGPDGLDHIRLVERAAATLLRPGGWAVVEHADQQGTTAPAVFSASGAWCDVLDHQDLAGRDRFLTASRAASLGGD